MRKEILFCLILGGCMVGPNYTPPENNVGTEWNGALQSEIALAETPLVKWWEVFEDPLLSKYMSQAAENNQDVLTAMSRVVQARALRQIAASSFYPQIGADVNATRTYFSKNGPVFAIGPSVGSVPGTVSPVTGLDFDVQAPQTQNLYNALFDASWEIDLFGKTRRAVEAADAVVESTIEKRNEVLISVMGEIGSNYIELRSFQEREKLVAQNIEILEQKALLIRKQYEVGFTSRLDDENIQGLLSSERAKLPDLKAQIYRSIYTLSILIGLAPEALLDELLAQRALPKLPEKVAVGLRSDLLRRRPDIRRAERDLAAATANIGVAIAAYFPTFTLVGDAGFQTLTLKNLFSLASRTWAGGGDLNMPIFEGGKITGNVQAKRAETAAVGHTYQQTVLNALEETESAIISYNQDLLALKETQDAASRYHELVFLSKERNERGLISRLNVLDSEREYNQSEQTVLDRDSGALLDLIKLYKSLGGGWECTESDSKIEKCEEGA